MNAIITQAEKWIADRPYLEEVGGLYLAIYSAMENLPESDAETDFGKIKKCLEKGIPALKCEDANFPDFQNAALCFKALSGLYKNDNLPESFRKECREIAEKAPSFPLDAVKKAISGEEISPLVSFFAWTAIGKSLEPYRGKLEEVQKTWLEGTCPTCAGEPVMSVLKRTKRGRERFLVCGRCHTEWGYKRIGCPYCGNAEPEKLSVIEAQGEKDVRIDACLECGSYIKTYTDKGGNFAGREDWASLHIDLLCKDAGYKKRGGLLEAE